MKRNDSWWTMRVTEWMLRDGSRGRGRTLTRRGDEKKKFGGKEWIWAAHDRSGWRSVGAVLQWT